MIVELVESLLPTRRPEEGAHPGTLAFPEQRPVKVTAIRYSHDKAEFLAGVGLDEMRPELGPAEVFWLDIQGLSDRAVFERLATDHGVHPLAMADILHTPQQPSVAVYGGQHLVITRMVSMREDKVCQEQLSVLVCGNYVISIQEDPGDNLDPIRRRIRERLGYIRDRGPDYLVYAIVDAVVDGYYPLAEDLGAEIAALERDVIEGKASRDTLMRLYELESELLGMARPMRQQRDMLRVLIRDENQLFSDANRPFVVDVYDHALQVLNVVELYREMGARLMSLHLSMSNNKMNEVMKVLSVVAGTFVPATFIAAIYGMNFKHMPELEWWLGYPAALSLMACVGAGMLFFFRRSGML